MLGTEALERFACPLRHGCDPRAAAFIQLRPPADRLALEIEVVPAQAEYAAHPPTRRVGQYDQYWQKRIDALGYRCQTGYGPPIYHRASRVAFAWRRVRG